LFFFSFAVGVCVFGVCVCVGGWVGGCVCARFFLPPACARAAWHVCLSSFSFSHKQGLCACVCLCVCVCLIN
jgi:hypothetical protein